jgi:DNA-binding NarL/FixJ family response regulator
MKRRKIVIADDHEVVVEGLHRILDRRRFDVVGVANDGLALIQAAERLRPDVIVTDLAMPRLNGIDAAREIRRRNPNLKIIFLTMHAEVAYATAALGAGAAGYLLKSAAGEELIDAIDAALDEPPIYRNRSRNPCKALARFDRRMAAAPPTCSPIVSARSCNCSRKGSRSRKLPQCSISHPRPSSFTSTGS